MIRKLYQDWKTLVVIFAGTGFLIMSIGTVLPTASAGQVLLPRGGILFLLTVDKLVNTSKTQ